jgi:hypothetical protein
VREFVKSFFSLGIAASLFPLKQIDNLLAPVEPGDLKNPATEAMDSVTSATLDQFGGTLRATFSALDNVQRGIVALGFGLLPSGSGARQRQGTGPLGRNGKTGSGAARSGETWWTPETWRPETGRPEENGFDTHPETLVRARRIDEDDRRNDASEPLAVIGRRR